MSPNERALLTQSMMPVSGHQEFFNQARAAQVVDTGDDDAIRFWIPPELPRANLPGSKVLTEGY
jgi:hypothetical protein